MNKIAFIITIVTLTLISALHAQMQIKSSDGSTLATMTQNGNFGIGVMPSYKLDVSGNARFTQPVTIGTYTLPNTDGTPGQVFSTNGAGAVSWQSLSGDNLGNHTATQNLQMQGHHISYDGATDEGLYMIPGGHGKVGLGIKAYNWLADALTISDLNFSDIPDASGHGVRISFRQYKRRDGITNPLDFTVGVQGEGARLVCESYIANLLDSDNNSTAEARFDILADRFDYNPPARAIFSVREDGRLALGNHLDLSNAFSQTMNVYGNAVIGSTFNSDPVPNNGLWVQGYTGIGTSAPGDIQQPLRVEGLAQHTIFFWNQVQKNAQYIKNINIDENDFSIVANFESLVNSTDIVSHPVGEGGRIAIHGGVVDRDEAPGSPADGNLLCAGSIGYEATKIIAGVHASVWNNVAAPSDYTTAAGYFKQYRSGDNDFGIHVLGTKNYFDGRVGIGLTNPTHRIHIVGGAYCDGANWVAGSSRAFKRDIEDLSETEAFTALEQLRPVKYRYRENYVDQDQDLKVGFIAEEMPELLAEPDRKGVNPMDVIGVLTKIVKEQDKKLKTYEQRLRALEENR